MLQTLRQSLRCKCPKCKNGSLYQSGLTIDLRNECKECGLDYTKGDAADGPAVFMIFILGSLLVPLALALEFSLSPPLWVHIILWSVVTFSLTIGGLRPVKSYVMALQFKYRPDMFDE